MDRGRLLSAPKVSAKTSIVLGEEVLDILGLKIGDRVAIREQNGLIILTNGLARAEV